MDLSILIPARNEIFLRNTIEDITKNIRGETEVIVVLDGEWANPPIIDHPRVTLIYHPESIGQRAATNEAARLSKAKYLMKCDAHCAFDEGFDVKMMADMQDDWTMVPIMRNLHVFNWVCKKCGNETYQGPTPCTHDKFKSCSKCGNAVTAEFERKVVWIAKTNPQSIAYCFDTEPHFQYFSGFKRRKEARGDLTETMSLQGSCFMITREKYWELDICDDKTFGSWGSQGIEVACKTWLSGGRVICTHKTWYAHLFRTQGGDFAFPYHNPGRQIQKAKETAKDIFFNNRFPKQIYPISWLVEKFWPVPGWNEESLAAIGGKVPAPKIAAVGLTKGIVYYTDNLIDQNLAQTVMDSILSPRLPIVSVSLQPVDFFGVNIVLELERSYLTMFKQILEGLESIDTDIVFLCEHDVIYDKEHFEFTPVERDRFYYNKNNWQIDIKTGFAVYWECKKVSQICAYRDLMIKHYVERVRRVEAEGFTRRMGFEPGSHGRPERVDNYTSEFFQTKIPNLDIRHGKNLTLARWSPEKFRNPCKDWTESHVNKLPGWEDLKL